MNKVNLSKRDEVTWEIEISAASDTIPSKLAYTDDFENWIERCPDLKSEHPDFSQLKLVKIKATRLPGLQVRVELDYECTLGSKSVDRGEFPVKDDEPVKRYDMELGSAEEPLLAATRYKDISTAEREALSYLMQGTEVSDDGQKWATKVVSVLGNEALDKIRKGRSAYKSNTLIWIERFQTEDISKLAVGLNRIQDPPGDPPKGGDYNYLYIGATTTNSDDGLTWSVERRWELSDAKGWDPELYGPEVPIPDAEEI